MVKNKVEHQKNVHIFLFVSTYQKKKRGEKTVKSRTGVLKYCSNESIQNRIFEKKKKKKRIIRNNKNKTYL